jgi:hypothetical protein
LLDRREAVDARLEQQQVHVQHAGGLPQRSEQALQTPEHVLAKGERIVSDQESSRLRRRRGLRPHRALVRLFVEIGKGRDRVRQRKSLLVFGGGLGETGRFLEGHAAAARGGEHVEPALLDVRELQREGVRFPSLEDPDSREDAPCPVVARGDATLDDAAEPLRLPRERELAIGQAQELLARNAGRGAPRDPARSRLGALGVRGGRSLRKRFAPGYGRVAVHVDCRRAFQEDSQRAIRVAPALQEIGVVERELESLPVEARGHDDHARQRRGRRRGGRVAFGHYGHYERTRVRAVDPPHARELVRRIAPGFEGDEAPEQPVVAVASGAEREQLDRERFAVVLSVPDRGTGGFHRVLVCIEAAASVARRGLSPSLPRQGGGRLRRSFRGGAARPPATRRVGGIPRRAAARSSPRCSRPSVVAYWRNATSTLFSPCCVEAQQQHRREGDEQGERR